MSTSESEHISPRTAEPNTASSIDLLSRQEILTGLGVRKIQNGVRFKVGFICFLEVDVDPIAVEQEGTLPLDE